MWTNSENKIYFNQFGQKFALQGFLHLNFREVNIGMLRECWR